MLQIKVQEGAGVACKQAECPLKGQCLQDRHTGLCRPTLWLLHSTCDARQLLPQQLRLCHCLTQHNCGGHHPLAIMPLPRLCQC